MARTSPVFVVGATEVTDPTPLARYLAQVGATIERYGGRIRLAGPATVLEGAVAPSIAAVIEFPDAVAAATWYDSPEHAAIRPLRAASGVSSVVLVEGAPAESPGAPTAVPEP